MTTEAFLETDSTGGSTTGQSQKELLAVAMAWGLKVLRKAGLGAPDVSLTGVGNHSGLNELSVPQSSHP